MPRAILERIFLMINEKKIEQFAWEIRRGIVEAISSKGGGHIGGTLDLAELLAVLYGEVMNVRPEEPDWEGRDYLICSKGHAGPALYSALAIKGFFPYERLKTLNKGGTLLPGHCDRKVPGVDATTGSLGQGLSIASGIALGFKLSGSKQRVFCIIGDGELDEGQNWEAIQFAVHNRLSNLTVFLDWNKKQIDGTNDQVMSHGNLSAKFSAFGCNVCTVNGRDIPGIYKAAEAAGKSGSKPSVIILDTVKGAGIPCIEQIENNHCIGFPKTLADTAFAELNSQKDVFRTED